MGVVVDSFAGPVRVEWDHEAALTPLGQLPFFIDFLKTAGLFEAFVADCPLRYASPNAPKKRDVLGTAMLSMLAGHKRYAHIAALRGDAVLPELLGMSKIVSEDAVRRAFKAIEEEAGADWLRGHLDHCVEPLLAEPWILDVDTTIKPLYGHQEGAVLGYNPKKPGRPSHCYHTYSMASTRLVLDVDVSPGDEHASKHSAPGLWALIDRRRATCWPALVARRQAVSATRGSCARPRRAALPYSVQAAADRQRQAHDREAFAAREWVDAGQGLEPRRARFGCRAGADSGASIVLRRRVKGAVGLSRWTRMRPPQLSFLEIGRATEVYEYSVLATSLDEDTEAFGQLYRDRGDGENIFDEMKNQWGWGGFTTHDLARCRLAARLLALFYDWWNIFVRLAEPDRHREAITSRPLLLSAIAERARAMRDKPRSAWRARTPRPSPPPRRSPRSPCSCGGLATNAEQLTPCKNGARSSSRAFQAFLNGRVLRAPPRLCPS